MKPILWALCFLILSACATTQSIDKAKQTKSTEKSGDRLAPQQMSPGECGLFVWTGDADRRFILYSQSSNRTGLWASGSGETQLAVMSNDGIPTEGQFPKTTFRTEDARILELSLRLSQPIDDGTRYKAGTLTETSQEGWETVMPIVGLSACQPR